MNNKYSKMLQLPNKTKQKQCHWPSSDVICLKVRKIGSILLLYRTSFASTCNTFSHTIYPHPRLKCEDSEWEFGQHLCFAPLGRYHIRPDSADKSRRAWAIQEGGGGLNSGFSLHVHTGAAARWSRSGSVWFLHIRAFQNRASNENKNM